MKIKVLIAHAKGEENLAEQLAQPIRAAGYEVAHEGTVLVGESVIAEASRLLAEGVPVVLCGTVRAMGTKWAKQVAQAARRNSGVRLFVVQMEEDADVETVSFDESIARHWQDPTKAEHDLVAALQKYYPADADARLLVQHNDLEARYRELVLKSCDIVDLINLPEDDRHLATRELELRRLYVALRMKIEADASDNADDTLQALESRRLGRWGKNSDAETKPDEPVSLGARLKEARRLVVLGDPGAGKSTLLRWLATAFLLRMKNDPDWRDLPDIATLPDNFYLPILVRCRDLPAKTTTLEDMLHHTLRMNEVTESECAKLRDLLRTRLTEGKALLLIDGLDEITDPGLRARFSQQIEQIHRAHPEAPIVVTSRIVGYREMGYRIRSGFEHLTVADLAPADKDDFARRWCTLTERVERRDAATEDLIHDIHSSDRIERLTGNPMLLTTMALIKRKVGKLPQRRVELYEKAVEVLLNWRSAVDEALDKREALPQLEFLAYEMCRRGVQQLREDEVLELLRQVRQEYPQIHPLAQHTPEEFLALLERRTGMVIQSGHQRHNGQSYPVYEFRHLTFQEYLAGIALVQGHFPGWDKARSLAEYVAPLAGEVGQTAFGKFSPPETAVVENWREALRLCVAACNDGDVDAVLQAILTPLPGEQDTERARAVLAALCLADEPNVSDGVAESILQVIPVHVIKTDGDGVSRTSLDVAVVELAATRWRGTLLAILLNEFFRSEGFRQHKIGAVYSEVVASDIPKAGSDISGWLTSQVDALESGDERMVAGAALAILDATLSGINCYKKEIVSALLAQLDGNAPVARASAWALWWIEIPNNWQPSVTDVRQMVAFVAKPGLDSITLRWLIPALGKTKAHQAVGAISQHLENEDEDIRSVAAYALGSIGDVQAIDALHQRLADKQENISVRRNSARAIGKTGGDKSLAILCKLLSDGDFNIRCAALSGLAETCEDRVDQQLLSGSFLPESFDPQSSITEKQIAQASRRLSLPEHEIRRRYEALA